MGAELRSALLAGFIASTIWMFITVAVDMSKGAVLGGGIIFLVGVSIVTAVIARVLGNKATAGAL